MQTFGALTVSTLDKEGKFHLSDIVSFVMTKTGCAEDEIRPDSDIDVDLGCTGDDFHELIEEYSSKFGVDIKSYLWYFHTTEEGHVTSLGRALYKSPYELVVHIAVTPTILLDSANCGTWIIEYPEHVLPHRRNDILLNHILILIFIVLVIYKCSQ